MVAIFFIKLVYKEFTIPKMIANKKVLNATFFSSLSNSESCLFLATVTKFFIKGINAIKNKNCTMDEKFKITKIELANKAPKIRK